jgi:uncharacterized protein (TIGR03437 family)
VTLSPSGGVAPYEFALESGSLPEGIGLSATGRLSGTPVRKGGAAFVVRVTDGSRQAARASFTIQVLGAIPQFTAASLLNAASFRDGLAPGEYVTIFGAYLAQGTEAARQLPLPTSAAGTTVYWKGSPLPLLAVSAGQINAQLPFDAPGPGQLTISSDGVTSAPVTITIQQASPGLFLASEGVLLAINEDGTFNGPDNPAKAGSVIVFYGTGCGAYEAALRSGDAVPTDRLYRLAADANVAIGGLAAETLFAGAAPGLGSGLVQFNVRIPVDAVGPSMVQATVAGVASNPARLFVSAR